MTGLIDLNEIGAFLSVVIIDVALAGDNAVIVGMAASRLPAAQRRQAILIGVAVATLFRIAFAAFAVSLLEIVGLTLAGGILLLFVAWRFYRELRSPQHGHAGTEAATPSTRFMSAVWRIVLADISMSLDNVLAVAGAARNHFWVLAAGLLLSVLLMGIASTLVARLLARYRWIAWLGLAIVTAVALRMIYEGSSEVISEAAPTHAGLPPFEVSVAAMPRSGKINH